MKNIGNTLGDRLRIFAKKYGSLKNLAERLDLHLSNLSIYVNNKNEPGAAILKKLRELGCDINWLLTGETLDKNEEMKIPLLSSPASAGHGNYIVDDSVGYIDLSHYNKPSVITLVISDSSMEPNLSVGDIIIADRLKLPKSNDVAVVIINDNYIIRRISIINNMYILTADNREYPPLTTDKTNIIATITNIIKKL